MVLNFKKITIHHFLSFEHAIVELSDKGYCLVSGVNRNPKDFAKSNGAGKSTVFNAISYALTGETLQGLKSNLANIYFDDGCWVELEFEVNGHQYVLTRSKDDKTLGTNLKIVIDNEDKSGKGIRESNELLSQYLPELTSELIGSTILIGQGMPMKFTDNSPSGRKEVLEHLSQSDFMIQDIKERINKRVVELSDLTRSVDDSLLRLDTLNTSYQNQLKTTQDEYNEKYTKEVDFDSLLKNLNDEKNSVNETITKSKESKEKLSRELNELREQYKTLTKSKSDWYIKFANEYSVGREEFSNAKTKLTNEIYSLEQEITKLKNIKDICPTCGQKIPGVVKQDTTVQENQVNKLKYDLSTLEEEMKLDYDEYQNALNKVNANYDDNINKLDETIKSKNGEVSSVESLIEAMSTKLEQVSSKIAQVTSAKEFYDVDKKRVLNTIEELNGKIEEISKNKEIESKARDLLKERNEVISKMNTIVKRDFRGFLLKNIIDYINAKAKEYASQIFGCDEINFELDGNDINIAFCGKDYENLSGGEKQRVDLIVQFAIRSFMCNFLQFSSNILVLDEITDALDSESCDRVINFITNELKDIESVFIISHHADALEIPYDSELVIEKSELGVSNVIHQE